MFGAKIFQRRESHFLGFYRELNHVGRFQLREAQAQYRTKEQGPRTMQNPVAFRPGSWFMVLDSQMVLLFSS